MKRKITAALICVALTATLLLSACSGSESKNDSGLSDIHVFGDILYSGPFEVEGPDGETGFLFQVINNTDHDLYVAGETGFFTGSILGNYTYIGSSQVRTVPALEAGESTFLYAPFSSSLYKADDLKNVVPLFETQTANWIPAGNDIKVSVEEGSGYMDITAQNPSSEKKLHHLQIEVIFLSENVPVAYQAGTVNSDSGSTVDAGGEYSAHIHYPNSEFNDYLIYVTGSFSTRDE